jgi:ribosomal protein L37AE/L43A
MCRLLAINPQYRTQLSHSFISMDAQDDLSVDSNDDGMSSNRTAKACDSCHRSKARCGGDGIHACTACSRKGLECVYSMAKKRGPKSGALRAMQDEIEALRNQVRTLSNASKVRPGEDRDSSGKQPPTK